MCPKLQIATLWCLPFIAQAKSFRMCLHLRQEKLNLTRMKIFEMSVLENIRKAQINEWEKYRKYVLIIVIPSKDKIYIIVVISRVLKSPIIRWERVMAVLWYTAKQKWNFMFLLSQH